MARKSPGRQQFWAFVVLLMTVHLSPACKDEAVPEPFVPSRAYDAYVFGLEQSGLGETALAREWTAAGREALETPQSVELPFREAVYVDPAQPAAFGYRFKTIRGQVVKVRLEDPVSPELRLFIDIFRAEETGPTPFVLIASAQGRDRQAQFEPRADNEYIIRIQPELLRGGQFTLSVVTQPAFDFPVEGRSTRSIQSRFGVPREAGRRSHHGVDIFAPRHTPVLAPCRAFVRTVGENRLGGNVVWLTDSERSLSLYFAHLQDQRVQEGTWVEPGDVLGTVGNSGNARTTPTHLHFGLYSRGEGPIDPYYYLHSISAAPPSISADLSSLGQWVRVLRDRTSLLQKPSDRQSTLLELGSETPIRVIGAADQFLKLRVPDGRIGYVEARFLTLDPDPLQVLTLSQNSGLWSDAGLEAVLVGQIKAGTEVSVLGEFEDSRLIAGPEKIAWIRPSLPLVQGVEEE